MGLEVGELNVKFDAESGELQKDLGQLDDRLEKSGDNAEKQGGRFSKVFQALPTALLVGTRGFELADAAQSFFFKRAIFSALKLIPPLRLVAIGITAVAAAFTAGRFLVGRADEGLRLAGAFEQITVALGTLTGGAQNARRVLGDVQRIVLETPFGLQQLAGVARQLAVVFGEDTAAISEFTRITADIAAIAGRDVEQIGGQIQRALVSGLGSADVLREAGITQLLVEAAGATDAAELSGQRLLDAFRKLTSEGGRAFQAAAAQALTLEGALSNAQIASEQASQQFGEFLADDTRDRALNTQRAFVALRESIVDFEPAIRFASGVFTLFKNLLQDLSVVGIQLVSTTFRALRVGTQAITTVIVAAAVVIQEFIETFVTLGDAISRVATGDFRGAIQSLQSISLTDSAPFKALQDTFDNLVESATGGERSLKVFANSFLEIFGAADRFGFVIDEATASTNRNTEANKENTASLVDRSMAEQSAAKTIQDALAQLNREEGIRAEIAALDDQIRATTQLAVAEVDRARQGELLNRLAERRIELATQLAQAEANLPQVLTAVNAQIASLGQVDPRAARDFAIQLSEALTQAGGDATAQVRAAAEVAQAIRDRAEQEDLARLDRLASEERRQNERTARERMAATEQLARLADQAELAQLEAGDRRVAQLDAELARVRELAALTGDRATAERAINALQAERLKLVEEQARVADAQARAQEALQGSLPGLNRQIEELGRLDPEQASRFALELQRGLVAAGEDPAAAQRAVAEVSQSVRDALADTVGPTLGTTIAESVGMGFRAGAQGEAPQFAELIGSAIETRARTALDKAFDESVKSFGDLLESTLQGAAGAFGDLFSGLTGEGGPLSGLAGVFGGEAGQLLGQTALAAVGQGIRALSRDDSITSTAGQVRSAVDSVERVRGIVAGPTQIAVAQVDRAISDAFVETNGILSRSEGLLRRIAARIGSPAGSAEAGGAGEATTILANEGASLA